MLSVIEASNVKENICHRLLLAEINHLINQLHFQDDEKTFSYNVVILVESWQRKAAAFRLSFSEI